MYQKVELISMVCKDVPIMYAYVKGKLTHLYPTHVVVETAGVG